MAVGKTSLLIIKTFKPFNIENGCFLNIIGKFSSYAFSLIFLTGRMSLQRRAGPSSSFLCYGKHLYARARTHLIQTQFPSPLSCDSFLGAVKRLQGHPWLRVMIIFKCLVSATASKDLAGNIAAVHFEEGQSRGLRWCGAVHILDLVL